MYTYIVVVDYYPYPAYTSLARVLEFFNLNSPTFAMKIQIDSAFWNPFSKIVDSG